MIRGESAPPDWPSKSLVVNRASKYLKQGALLPSYTVPLCWCHNVDMPKIHYSQVIEEDTQELKELEKYHRYSHLFQRVRML